MGTPKTGGRKKGTPNKTSLAVAEKLAALNCDPLEGFGDNRYGQKRPARHQGELLQRTCPIRVREAQAGGWFERGTHDNKLKHESRQIG